MTVYNLSNFAVAPVQPSCLSAALRVEFFCHEAYQVKCHPVTSYLQAVRLSVNGLSCSPEARQASSASCERRQCQTST